MTTFTQVLSQLKEWRHLPKYKLEPHIDVYFGLLLPAFLKTKFDVMDAAVIPEFPIHESLYHKLDSSSNRSVNVDFAAFTSSSRNKERIFLVELKTDMTSLDEDQLIRMVRARNEADYKGKRFLKEVKKIATHSDLKHKYAHLIWMLLKLGCFKETGTVKLEDLLLEDKRIRLNPVFKSLKVDQGWGNASIELILITPSYPNELDDAVRKHFCCITFSEFICGLQESGILFRSDEEDQFRCLLDDCAQTNAGEVTPW